jgi:hypothetical protein
VKKGAAMPASAVRYTIRGSGHLVSNAGKDRL